MAPHSSTLAWKIPWTEEPGRLQSMGSLRVGHDWVTFLSLFTFMHWRRKWQPTPVFLPGESQGWGSLVGCRLWGRTESDQLKRLSSSSSSSRSLLQWINIYQNNTILDTLNINMNIIYIYSSTKFHWNHCKCIIVIKNINGRKCILNLSSVFSFFKILSC